MAVDFTYLQDSMKSIFDSISKLTKPYAQATEIISGITKPLAELAKSYEYCMEPLRDVMSQVSKLNTQYSYVFEDAAKWVNALDLDEIQKVRAGLTDFAADNELELSVEKTDTQDIAKEITEIPAKLAATNMSTRKKRVEFLKFLVLLVKFGASNIVAIILFLCQPYYQPLGLDAPKNSVIYESILEAEQIKVCEGVAEELRVVAHDTNLYCSPALSGVVYRLSVGDILIVLEKDKTILRVRDYETGVEGYIRKKYTVTTE